MHACQDFTDHEHTALPPSERHCHSLCAIALGIDGLGEAVKCIRLAFSAPPGFLPAAQLRLLEQALCCETSVWTAARLEQDGDALGNILRRAKETLPPELRAIISSYVGNGLAYQALVATSCIRPLSQYKPLVRHAPPPLWPSPSPFSLPSSSLLSSLTSIPPCLIACLHRCLTCWKLLPAELSSQSVDRVTQMPRGCHIETSALLEIALSRGVVKIIHHDLCC